MVLIAGLFGLAWAQSASPVPVPPEVVAYTVRHRGEVVWADAPGPLRPRRRKGAPEGVHDIRSAGKSLTALAVVAAVGDGQLQLGDSVWAVLGAEAPPELADVTVDDLLFMGSPLDCNDWDRRSPGQEERMYRRKHWRPFVEALPRDPDFRRSQGLGRFSYCTAGVFLLGQVVQAAVGERFDTYVERRLFAPLGVGAVQWARSRAGEVQAGGQLSIRSDDLARIGQLVLDEGRWQGEAVLDAEVLATVLTPRHQLGREMFYGGLWWATRLPTASGPAPAWFMSGNGGNIVVVSRAARAVVVVQAEAYNRPHARERTMDWAAELLQRLPP